MHILNERELNNLEKYKHFAEKTSIELWFCRGITAWIDKCLPEYWTPNVITLIG
jgi:hypothetical protein